MCERGLAYTKCICKSTVILTKLMHWCSKTCTSGNLLRSKHLQYCHPGLRGLERKERWSVTTIMVALCSSFVSEFPLLPALGPTSLVFLFLHVFARHPLSPLCQPLTSRAVFDCPEAAAMVTRMALCERDEHHKNRSQRCNTSEHVQHKWVIYSSLRKRRVFRESC